MQEGLALRFANSRGLPFLSRIVFALVTAIASGWFFKEFISRRVPSMKLGHVFSSTVAGTRPILANDLGTEDRRTSALSSLIRYGLFSCAAANEELATNGLPGIQGRSIHDAVPLSSTTRIRHPRYLPVKYLRLSYQYGMRPSFVKLNGLRKIDDNGNFEGMDDRMKVWLAQVNGRILQEEEREHFGVLGKGVEKSDAFDAILQILYGPLEDLNRGHFHFAVRLQVGERLEYCTDDAAGRRSKVK
jgi:hypothetical protein